MTEMVQRREAKRQETARRLQHWAVQLTLDHGFDGWTMDDLAGAADVSRRTVFNYFDTKADVVLGPMAELDADRVEVFVAGGPTGNLLDDVIAVSSDLVAEHTHDLEMLPAWRRAVMADTRLILLVHERFEAIVATFVEHVLAREGAGFGVPRARLLSKLVVTVFDSALERAEARPDQPFAEHFAAAVADARAVLA
jgi:AcrR family transcriptional regulator